MSKQSMTTYIEAARALRKSNAAGPHRNRKRYRRRSKHAAQAEAKAILERYL